MGDLKKTDLLRALADLDGAAEQLIEAVRLRNETHPGLQILDKARFWPEPVRDAVNRIRKERGDVTDEQLMHEAVRRINLEFNDGTNGWEVKGWREIERLETGERVFEVELLGVELPVEGEELISAKPRGDLKPGEKPSDFCECGHTRGSHYLEIPDFGEGTKPAECGVEGCGCSRFTLLAAGVEGVEEMPPDPGGGEELNPSVVIENAAIRFWRTMEHEASLDEADATTWMALQRLLYAGWRFIPPPEPDGD